MPLEPSGNTKGEGIQTGTSSSPELAHRLRWWKRGLKLAVIGNNDDCIFIYHLVLIVYVGVYLSRQITYACMCVPKGECVCVCVRACVFVRVCVCV